jgi:MFS family permease
MSKARKILFLTTLMLINIVIIGDFLFLPTVNDVYKLFPNNSVIVNFVVSGNYLMIVFASILAGKLCGILGQKIVIILGSICALAGGVLLLAIENVFFMCAMRMVFAFGFAFCDVACISLISEMYTEDNKRISMMSYFTTARFTLGAGLSVVGGILAAVSVRAAYSGYWMILPVIVLEILFLPNIRPVKLDAEHDEQPKSPGREGKKQGFGGLYWSIVIGFGFFCFVIIFFMFFLSVYVAENDLGTPAVAGYASAIYTIGCCAASLSFGIIYKKIGKAIILLAYMGAAIVYLVAMAIPTVTVLYVTSIFRGAVYVVFLTYCYSICPAIVPKERSKDAIGILTAIYSFMIFIAPFVTSWAMKHISNGRFTPTLIIPIIVCIGLFVIQIFLDRKQLKENPS